MHIYHCITFSRELKRFRIKKLKKCLYNFLLDSIDFQLIKIIIKIIKVIKVFKVIKIIKVVII